MGLSAFTFFWKVESVDQNRIRGRAKKHTSKDVQASVCRTHHNVVSKLYMLFYFDINIYLDNKIENVLYNKIYDNIDNNIEIDNEVCEWRITSMY